jgi:hypothetical protein
MRIWHAKVEAHSIIMLRQLHAETQAEAEAVARRYVAAASRITGDAYSLMEVLEDYPSEFILSARKVADLEYMAHRMKGGKDA